MRSPVEWIDRELEQVPESPWRRHLLQSRALLANRSEWSAPALIPPAAKGDDAISEVEQMERMAAFYGHLEKLGRTARSGSQLRLLSVLRISTMQALLSASIGQLDEGVDWYVSLTETRTAEVVPIGEGE